MKKLPLSLILADDHAIVRDGIAALCQEYFDVSLLGQFSNGMEALDAIIARNPDFAILNIDAPKPIGMYLVEQIRQRDSNNTRLIALSSSRHEWTIRELFRRGLNGYVLQDESSEQIPDAIYSIRRGMPYVSPVLRQKFIVPGTDPMPKLTKREYEIYTYLVHGLRNREIAASLELSPKTVHAHRVNLMRKVGVDSLAALVQFDIQRNLTLAKERVCYREFAEDAMCRPAEVAVGEI